MSNPKKVTASSGNVFADLGFGNPEEELFKAKLVRENRGIIKRRKLTQTKGCCHARSQAAGRQSFRGDAKQRTRNLEIPGLRLTAHPGMTESGLSRSSNDVTDLSCEIGTGC